MATNYIQAGVVLDHTAAADIVSGEVVVMGVRVGVALADIATGDTGAVQVDGVFEVAKTSANTPAQGAALYWNSTADEATTTASGNTLMGYAVEAAGAGVLTVKVKLNA